MSRGGPECRSAHRRAGVAQGESAAPGAASAARAGVWLSFAGRSGRATQAVRIPQRVAAWPFDAYSLAASHSARRPSCVAPHRGTTSDRSSVTARDLAPRPVALLRARLIARAARSTSRRSAMAVEESPPFARDRDVAPGALAARRPFCRAFAARHVQHLPVPLTPDASSGNAPVRRQVSAADCTTPSLIPHQSRV